MVKIKKALHKILFSHNNHGEEPAGVYGENTTYIIYIIFSPYMVNVVYTIHRENKGIERKLGRRNHVAHRRHLLLLNMVQGDALLVLIDL